MQQIQQDEYRRISGLRAHLDGYAARQAAACAAGNPEGCRELRNTLARLRSALQTRDYAAFEQTDFDLHTAIIHLAAVPYLYESWMPVWRGLHELHSTSFEECWPDLRVLVREHTHLVEDICRGDPNAAEQTAQSHVQAVWRRYDYLNQTPDDTDPLERTTAAIAFRLGTPISLREIAEKTAFVSAGHLSRLFRERYGVSFQKYLQNQRLDKASRLLVETSLSVAEIARRVGYNDVSRFGQHFKRRFGTLPKDSRKQNAGYSAFSL
ncbi:MAG: helix-turn-helix domain-containing protein [Candidatus Pacebacteria bacterium]|nr:helix-turn-helix domain-containing protein [Candidatus Paceibacterota bacterium]